MSCRHDCEKPPAFPERIFNRPGLSTVAYRVGRYDELRRHMLDQIDRRPELTGWTHREADEPGIALLEAGAVAADILTFYQELYGNECFLRTAKWQESVFDLVRLTGYRPAPGVGGTATFAVEAKGVSGVTIPQESGFKVKLDGADQQAEFESTEKVVAYPYLSEFHLYRPRLSERNITPDTCGNCLELRAEDCVSIRAGDRMMLVSNSPEILVVAKVETILDRVVLTFEGALTESRGTTVDAYLLGRTFRHFGYDAPPLTTTLSGDPAVASTIATRFTRAAGDDDVPTAGEGDYYSTLAMKDMPLDKEVNDLASGGQLIAEGPGFTVVRTIRRVRSDSLTWGNKSGGTTVVTLNKQLVATDNSSRGVDIRKLRFHETVSPKFTLRAPTDWATGAFTDGKLNFYGTLSEAGTLAGRPLLLVGDDGICQEVTVQEELASLASGEDGSRMWEIELDKTPDFDREDFDEEEPSVTVYGNLVPATQGKTQSETVLGSGDNRESFQTFALPKSPLTYLVNTAATPPEVPELEIYVDRVQWERVDTFFAAGPDEKVYVVREDDDGKSWVQFGNGVTGARLSTGRNNVVAVYRTGSGASGEAAAGAKPQLTARVTGVGKVLLPSAVTGGAAAETRAVARRAAPGRMQSLGRLVALADYEAEALAIAGVVKARAYWSAAESGPLIQLVVLTESGTDADLESVRETMAGYDRCRGPVRHPIDVIGGVRQYVFIALQVGYDPALLADDVAAAVQSALGVKTEDEEGEDGLFALGARTFGQSAHLSQIVGHAQQAEGVRWVLAQAAQLIPPGTPAATDPTALSVPSPRVTAPALACNAAGILTLYIDHLELNLVADERKEACSA